MNRESHQRLLMRHTPYVFDTGIVCECGVWFRVTSIHHDPRPEWARHVVSAIYPE